MPTCKVTLILSSFLFMVATVNAQIGVSTNTYAIISEGGGRTLCHDTHPDQSYCEGEYFDGFAYEAGWGYSLSNFDDKLVLATSGRYPYRPSGGLIVSNVQALSTDRFRLENVPSRVFLAVTIFFSAEIGGDDPVSYGFSATRADTELTYAGGGSARCHQRFDDPSPICTVRMPYREPFSALSHLLMGQAWVGMSGTLSVSANSRILSVVALDSDGQPLPDAIIISGSGTEYPADFSYVMGQTAQGSSNK